MPSQRNRWKATSHLLLLWGSASQPFVIHLGFGELCHQRPFLWVPENGLGWTWCERQKSWGLLCKQPVSCNRLLTNEAFSTRPQPRFAERPVGFVVPFWICFVLTHLCWTVLVFFWMYIQHSSTCKFFFAQVKAWVWYKWAHRRGYLMGKIQCIGSLRCSRRPGPESAERKQRKKQIFRQGWLVLLLEKKTSWKIHFDSFCIFGIYHANEWSSGIFEKSSLGRILGEGWSSKQHKLRENCPDGSGQAFGRRASDQGSAISPSSPSHKGPRSPQ